MRNIKMLSTDIPHVPTTQTSHPTRVEEIQRIKTESPTVKGCPYNIRIVQNKLLDEKIEMWKKNILLFYFLIC